MQQSRDKYFLSFENQGINTVGDTVGERSKFKKNPTHTQDHGDDIATRGESVVYVPS